MNSIFPNNTPKPERVEVTKMIYNRHERRTRQFCIIVGGDEYAVLISSKPLKLDTVVDVEKCSRFSYKNALRVCDHFIHRNPEIKMIYRDSKTNKVILR